MFHSNNLKPILMFAALAIMMVFACAVIDDADESDAATVTIEAGQTKSFNLVNDLGWYDEPFYDECELEFSLRYTNLVTNQNDHCSGNLSGSWGSVSFSLPNLAKAGTGTITFEAVNPEDGEVVDTVSKSVTITNPHDGSSSSKPLNGFDLFLLDPQNIGSLSKTLYISQGSTVNYRVQGFSNDPTVTVTSGSGISKSINSSHRVTFSGSISADCTMSVTYGGYSWSIALKTVGSGSSSSYTCYLYYNANGGSGAPSTQSYTGTSTSSHSFTVASGTPTRSGYDFLGWSTSSSATSASHSSGDSILVSYNGSKTLYAVWQEKVTSYSITVYKGNWYSFKWVGGSDSTTYTTTSHTYTVASGTSFDIDWYGKSSESGSGTGYTYTTTYSSSNYNMATSQYGTSLGDSVTITKAAKYYPAVQMTSETVYTYSYTIKYNANGGSGAPGDTTGTSSSTTKSMTLASTTPTRSGYTFQGWSESSTATSATYSAGGTYSFDYGTTNLYAVWKQSSLTIGSVSKQYAVVGQGVSFTATCSPSNVSVSYAKSNASSGLTVSISGSTITCNASVAGTYTFTLTASASGYSSSSTTVTVQFVPVLAFTNAPSIGVIGS